MSASIEQLVPDFYIERTEPQHKTCISFYVYELLCDRWPKCRVSGCAMVNALAVLVSVVNDSIYSFAVVMKTVEPQFVDKELQNKQTTRYTSNKAENINKKKAFVPGHISAGYFEVVEDHSECYWLK